MYAYWFEIMVATFLLVNAVLGIIAFEWAWHKTRRFRNPIKELDEKFFMQARYDAVTWRKWKFYPGAMFLLIPRMVVAATIFIIAGLVINLFLIGVPHDQPFKRGCRRTLVRWLFKFFIQVESIFGLWSINTYDYKQSNYEEYLGKD